MSKKMLYHGAPNIVGRPKAGIGSPHRDFGCGFYCTENPLLAGEWACPTGIGGYVNRYELETRGLKVLDLTEGDRPMIRWLAILVSNRTIRADSELTNRAVSYLKENFGEDTRKYDIVKGYRGDDSYFSFASDFINNRVPLGRLASSMELGKDGIQYALVSERAMNALTFLGSEPVSSEEAFRRRCERDLKARSSYLGHGRRETIDEYDIMMEDLVLGRVDRDDPRLQ